jgi:Tfp pilus assembly protein PilN
MFGKLQLYIIGGIILFGALTGIYYSWRSGVEREALLRYNQVQLEQSIKDQELLRQKIDNINQKQKEIDEANIADKKIFSDKIDSITNDIDSKAVVNRPASKVLKDTIRKLKDIK